MQRDMMEQMYMQSAFSGARFGTGGLLTVTVLASLFLIVVFKPERIYSGTFFRWACTLVGLSILVPAIVSAGTSILMMGSVNQRSQSDVTAILLWFGSASGPVLLGLAVLAAFAALRLPAAPYTATPKPPEKHPLD